MLDTYIANGIGYLDSLDSNVEVCTNLDTAAVTSVTHDIWIQHCRLSASATTLGEGSVLPYCHQSSAWTLTMWWITLASPL